MEYDDHARQRWVGEPGKDTGAGRTAFERDRARVLHSAALRRLAGKTQVVGVGEEDFPRTRLTHSLECAQVGRELGAALGCDPDLVDAACLAHDLGHPPFGHTGEAALDEAAAGCGGFEGNAQTLRLLTRLEAKVLRADGRSAGLNLTRATLDAATKYPWTRREGTPKYGVYADDLPVFRWLREGAPEGRRCLEAQVMDWADDVAYSVHDVEDGVHARQVRLARLAADPDERAALCALTARHYAEAGPDELAGVLAELLARPEVATVAGYDGSLTAQVALKRFTSVTIGRFVAAAVRATRAAYGTGPLSRYAADLVVPDRIRAECALLKGVANRYVMQDPRMGQRHAHEREIIKVLVDRYAERAPAALDRLLRPAWQEAADDPARLRVVIDQVASLTDLSARTLYDQLVGGTG
ncbi:MAG: deoxyguanosinetriphosphate triphosphohydrolase [Mycobacteriales bacterium]|jgi:dGTPase